MKRFSDRRTPPEVALGFCPRFPLCLCVLSGEKSLPKQSGKPEQTCRCGTRMNPENLLRANRAYALRQTGFVTGGGVLVDDALLNRLVESGDCFAISFFGARLVALGEAFPQFAQ